MYKKIIAIVAGIALVTAGFSFAADNNLVGPTIVVKATKAKKQDERPVTVKEFFTRYCDKVAVGIPDVFIQIPLRIQGVKREDGLYVALQKCIYLGFIPNSNNAYNWGSAVTPRFVNVFVDKTLHLDPNFNEEKGKITRNDFSRFIDSLPTYQMLLQIGTTTRWGLDGRYQSPLIPSEGFSELSQIYSLIRSDYWTGNNITDKDLIQGAMKGMSEAVGDVHTQYFPPVEAQKFNDQLNGSFEGIGAYLDMVRPGYMIITSVLKDSPAQKAGLWANDRIVKVDNYTVSEKDALETIIGKIKGAAGTIVKITIERNGSQQTIAVTRAKITLPLIEYDVKSGTPVISIHTFGWTVANEWINILKKNQSALQNANKIIIDLRNNPGGSLQEVSDMLSDFVPKDQPVVITTSKYEEEKVVSSGRSIIDFSKKKIVILMNSSTASASEIMAGTIKDYFPSAVLIGETSYGKGSVQYLQTFDDNSSFKLTIAHWYTGKTKSAIEGVGLKPDLYVPLTAEDTKNGQDPQMEAALRQ